MPTRGVRLLNFTAAICFLNGSRIVQIQYWTGWHSGSAQRRLGLHRPVALGMSLLRPFRAYSLKNYPSRRRKTKCNGVRPKCGHCSSRKIPCEWPRVSSAVLNNSPSPLETTTVAERSSEPVLHAEDTVSDSGLPSRRGLQRCLVQFFKRHFSNDFCSFSYKPHFEDKAMAHPFLATAVVSLCSRYLPY